MEGRRQEKGNIIILSIVTMFNSFVCLIYLCYPLGIASVLYDVECYVIICPFSFSPHHLEIVSLSVVSDVAQQSIVPYTQNLQFVSYINSSTFVTTAILFLKLTYNVLNYIIFIKLLNILHYI